MKTRMRSEGTQGVRAKLDRRDVLWIVLAVALSAAIRFAFYGGMSSPDELNTLRNGAQWWTGRFELRDALFIHDTRPLMFVPVGWSFAAFGVSAATALLWPFIASLSVVFLAYLVARRVFGRETAVYTVFCAACFPLLAQEATRLLPGVVMNLLIALCALFFVVSEEAGRRRWLWLTGRYKRRASWGSFWDCSSWRR
jgi:4-amino-4-deoxy-L-arabinose transferase-like glycosyltransferase